MNNRRVFAAPNSKQHTEEQWRLDMAMRATGALTLAGGQLPGRKLAEHLGVSPRGLRPILVGCPWIVPRIREGERKRCKYETWYVLDPTELPKLLTTEAMSTPAPARPK